MNFAKILWILPTILAIEAASLFTENRPKRDHSISEDKASFRPKRDNSIFEDKASFRPKRDSISEDKTSFRLKKTHTDLTGRSRELNTANKNAISQENDITRAREMVARIVGGDMLKMSEKRQCIDWWCVGDKGTPGVSYSTTLPTTTSTASVAATTSSGSAPGRQDDIAAILKYLKGFKFVV